MNSILFKMSMSFKMSLSHCCRESHCCMSHIVVVIRCKNQILFCLVHCKGITKIYRLYRKMRENRYILHVNVYTYKIMVYLTLIDTVLPPPDRYL